MSKDVRSREVTFEVGRRSFEIHSWRGKRSTSGGPLSTRITGVSTHASDLTSGTTRSDRSREKHPLSQRPRQTTSSPSSDPGPTSTALGPQELWYGQG